MKKKEYQINWKIIDSSWKALTAISQLILAMDISISEEIYKNMCDEGKQFFKLKETYEPKTSKTTK